MTGKTLENSKRERETDRQTDRQTERERDRERDREKVCVCLAERIQPNK